MSKEKNMGSGLLIIAIVAIVALVAMTMFFSSNSQKTQAAGSATAVDSVILDQQNLVGEAYKLRDCLHAKCDTASNQRTCVSNYWDACSAI